MSLDENGVPILPPELRIYDSYKTDPEYARGFTYAWVTCVAIGVLIAAPRTYKTIRRGVWWESMRGVGEHSEYELLQEEKSLNKEKQMPLRGWEKQYRDWLAMLATWTLYQPRWLKLDIGQIIILAGYLFVLLYSILARASLSTNGNRPGFLTLAQLTPLFLLATKNNPLSFLLGRGYEKLNFLHRWAGRGILLSTTVHGVLWIRNHLRIGVSLNQDKERHGLAAYGVLCCIFLLSLRPVRNRLYQIFFITHVIGFVSFFILVAYHTPFHKPWIYPPLTFYTFDHVLRLLRYRVKPATLNAPNTQMTLIQVERCDFGWTGGQHVRLRIFLGTEVFESHALSICNAPSSLTSIPSSKGRILLGARVVGDWTRSLNLYATTSDKESGGGPWDKVDDRPVTVMIDGPYGGMSFDAGRYESVLLVAGGAGITFVLGVLDELVGRARKGEGRVSKVEVCWCIKSFGCINWFASQLASLAEAASKIPDFEVHFKFFVTCLCDPEAVPHIQNSETTIERPSIPGMLAQFITLHKDRIVRGECIGGGVGIVASGPESLVQEVRNAVARLGRAGELGGVALHTESFCL